MLVMPATAQPGTLPQCRIEANRRTLGCVSRNVQNRTHLLPSVPPRHGPNRQSLQAHPGLGMRARQLIEFGLLSGAQHPPPPRNRDRITGGFEITGYFLKNHKPRLFNTRVGEEEPGEESGLGPWTSKAEVRAGSLALEWDAPATARETPELPSHPRSENSTAFGRVLAPSIPRG